jgi:hypothetical protein
MRPVLAYPEGGVLSYCCGRHKELETSGVSQVLRDVAGAKHALKHGMVSLDPAGIQISLAGHVRTGAGGAED